MSDDVTEAIEKEAELLVRIEEGQRIANMLREANEKARQLMASGALKKAEAVLQKADAILQEWQAWDKRHG